MKSIRHTLKLFALSSIALTGIMCSEKSNTESDADTYFATHFQDDNKCPITEEALQACRMARTVCSFPTGKYKDSYSDEELSRFKACHEEYLSCKLELSNCDSLVESLTSGFGNTCVTLKSGELKCWGSNYHGELGYGHTQNIGDNELPSSVGYISIGGKAIQVTPSAIHTCALLPSGDIRCWGDNDDGALGYGNNQHIGDNELPDSVGLVPLGEKVKQISSEGGNTCAILESNRVKCWGFNNRGQLGIGSASVIGDNETPDSIDALPLGENALQVSVGGEHSCALLESNRIKCWGFNNSGQLGYGHSNNTDYYEKIDTRDFVSLPQKMIQISTGGDHTCALGEIGHVYCWGNNDKGQLGRGHTNNIGDNEPPSAEGMVPLDEQVIQISAGFGHTCALLMDSRNVRCWGNNTYGQLGYGHTKNIGDDENAVSIDVVPLGEKVKYISARGTHTCALLESNRIKCWGDNRWGQLGYGHTQAIGDNESIESVGYVELF